LFGLQRLRSLLLGGGPDGLASHPGSTACACGRRPGAVK
jgi:hypothetical protein